MNLAKRLMPVLQKSEQSGWLPSDIQSLKSWLVSDDPNNTILNSLLIKIADKSGNNTHASVFRNVNDDGGEIIASALNGRDVYQVKNAVPTGFFNINVIDGIASNVDGLTLAILYKKHTNSDDTSVFRVNVAGSNYSRAMIGQGYYVANGIYAGGRRLDNESFIGLGSVSSYNVNDWLIVVATFDYANKTLKLSVNGQLTSNTNFQSAGKLATGKPKSIGIGHTGGGEYSADGLYAEAMIFNECITDQNRQKIEGWFAHEWGLQSSLPQQHPFKNNKPA